MSRFQNRLAAVCLLIVASFATASSAIEAITYPGEEPNSVLVLVNGSMDHANKFEELGKIAKLRENGYAGTIISVAYTNWDYTRGVTFQHLRKTYIQPNAAAGRTVDLLGVSAGGALAALYAIRYPQEIRHAISLSPSIVFNRFLACLRMSWQPLACSFTPGAQRSPKLIVGYGENDRYLPAQQLLADQAGDSFTVAGDHTWRSFGPLFDRAIAQLLYSVSASRATVSTAAF